MLNDFDRVVSGGGKKHRSPLVIKNTNNSVVMPVRCVRYHMGPVSLISARSGSFYIAVQFLISRVWCYK